jgi:hypothetical protein
MLDNYCAFFEKEFVFAKKPSEFYQEQKPSKI